VAGLAFRQSDGAIVLNEPRPFIENLDDIPFVSQAYHRHLDTKPYFYGHSRHPLAVIVTGRGLSVSLHVLRGAADADGPSLPQAQRRERGGRVRVDTDNMPAMREIMIEDDHLTADKARCREFSQALIDAKATTIPWSANAGRTWTTRPCV